jgi:hypothetical protein
MPTKSIFLALGAPMSLAWVHESSCVEGSALPKSVESGKLSLNKVGIGRMSVKATSSTPNGCPRSAAAGSLVIAGAAGDGLKEAIDGIGLA